MARAEPEQQQPADPSVDDVVEAEGVAADDTEGHSLLTIELARTIDRDCARETERAGRNRDRADEGRPKGSR